MKDPKFLKEYQPSKIGGDKNPLRHIPGCYCIEHNESGMVYVGSTSSLSDRVNQSMSALKNNKHKNKPLQELYNNNPNISIYVEPANSTEHAQMMEQAVVDELKNTSLLCNIATDDVTKTRIGVKLSEEHKQILMETNKNRIVSDESKKKMSESHTGQNLSEELKQKLSGIHKDRLSTPEGKASHAVGIAKLSHAVVVNGVEYSSKSEASRTLGVDVTTIMYRCKSLNFPDTYEIREK